MAKKTEYQYRGSIRQDIYTPKKQESSGGWIAWVIIGFIVLAVIGQCSG